MERESKTIWVIVPCYNEAARLPTEEFRRFAAAERGVRFLFVDDGSADGTAKVVSALAAEIGGRTLILPRNSGKGEAVRQGFLALRDEPGCDLIGFWDADLATPLDEVPRLAATLYEHDLAMVMGSRWMHLGENRIRRRWSRHAPGRIFAFSVAWLLDSPVYDTQCGAKLFTAAIAAKLFVKPFLTRWFFDVELLRRLQCLRNSRDLAGVAWEVPLRCWRDVEKSKVNMFRAFADFLTLIFRWRGIGS